MVGSVEPSHVLSAMGCTGAEAKGAVRLSLGRGTTGAEIGETLDAFARVLGRMGHPG
jgi:cysteine desulfurase